MQKRKLTYTLGKQVIIVLGGGTFADNTPWPATRLRAEKAAELASEHTGATVICSGAGAGRIDSTRRSEAVIMAEILMSLGVEPRRLRVEDQSIDTIGNAVLSVGKYLYKQKPRPVFVVTSPFHVERATLAFRGALGPRWPLQVVACEPAADDAQRAPGEAGGVDWMVRFYQGVTPGHLPQVTRRLFDMGKPYYRTLPMLAVIAARAA